MAAAYYLQLKGIQVTLFDKAEQAGGMLRTEINDEILPKDVLDKEIEAILKTGVEFQGGQEINLEKFKKLKNEYNAIVVASGVISESSDKSSRLSNGGIDSSKYTLLNHSLNPV